MGYKVNRVKKLNTVNDLIFAVRKILGWNQEEFGEFFERNRVTISRWETGAQMSDDLETGIRIGIIACKLGLPVEEIVALGLPSLSAKEEAGEYRIGED